MKTKIKSVTAVVSAVAVSLTSLIAVSAAAFNSGDVDKDGKITASDARLALRASVNLENLGKEQKDLADVDFSGVITASDARLILRASVGLEQLQNRDKTFNGHKVANDSIGIEKGIVCIDPDCPEYNKEIMPSFNTLVNSLKEPGSTNYFYGYTKSTMNTPKPECKPSNVFYAPLAGIIENLLASSVEAGTTTEYSDFTNHRHVNNATFYVMGTPYISDLKESDIKSITTEKMNGVDFVKNLPNSFKSSESGTTYDLTKIKASKIGDVYKVTVSLNPETITNTKFPEGVTPIEKILNKNYNSELIENMKNLNSDMSFDDMPELAGMFVMDMSITTTCTVTYYFTADKFEPVAAKYDVNMDTASYMHTYIGNSFNKTEEATTTTTIKNITTQENYFFFNDFFTIK